jgi:hypothetical protein
LGHFITSASADLGVSCVGSVSEIPNLSFSSIKLAPEVGLGDFSLFISRKNIAFSPLESS